MASIKSYKDLIVWQKSMILVKEVFALTARFPKSELYGIIFSNQKIRYKYSIQYHAFGEKSVVPTIACNSVFNQT